MAAKIYVWEKWAGPVVDGHNDGISGSLSNCADFSLAHSGDCVAGLADLVLFSYAFTQCYGTQKRKSSVFVIFQPVKKKLESAKKLSQG